MSTVPSSNENDIESTIIAVLEALWTTRIERPDKPSSVARLSKKAQVPMSVLRRTLTNLKAADLVDFSFDEDGRGFVTLTTQGIAFCQGVEADMLARASNTKTNPPAESH